MKKDKWMLVSEYPLKEYPCGVRAGDRVRLRQDIIVRDHTDKPTGEVHHAGDVWTVLSGAEHEPHIIYLRQSDGERHTWEDRVFLESFEILPRDAV
jgi:hypothetical protein